MYLLDTHAFLWLLSPPVAAICKNNAQILFLSLASVWEIQIKIMLGKLTLAIPLPDLIADQEANGIQVLMIERFHIYELEKLPFHHRDPFDRLLVAQAMVENIPILSNDPLISQYPIQVIW